MANEFLEKIRRHQANAKAVFNESHVLDHEAQLSPLQKFIHFWVMVARGFGRNRCPVRASALAYTTLLALVPVLAVAISISTALLKSEEGKKRVSKAISEAINQVAPQLSLEEKVVDGSAQTEDTSKKDLPKTVLKTDSTQGVDSTTVIPGTNAVAITASHGEIKLDAAKGAKKVENFINESIANVQSGALGATATIALMFVAISLLANIEQTMNDIWGVTHGRRWTSRIIQYWAVITLGPILLLAASTLSFGSQVQSVQDTLQRAIPIIGPMIPKLISTGLFVLLFSAFYVLMPNAKVQWRAAMVGGLIAALLFQLNSQINSIYFGGVVRNSKLYGSLGTVPIFLLGIYISWIIVLLGAQAAYIFQNRRAYFMEKQAETINQSGREFVAFRTMLLVAERFVRGQQPPTLLEIGTAIGVSTKLITRVINPLLENHLVVEVTGPETAYSPGRPLDKITCYDILHALRTTPGRELHTRDDADRAVVQSAWDKIMNTEREVAQSLTLEQLVHQVPLIAPPPQEAGTGLQVRPVLS